MIDYAARVRRFLVIGRVGVVTGGVLTALGAGALAVSGLSEATLAADRAAIGKPLEFDSTGSTYRLVLLADPLDLRIPFVANPEALITCSAALSDGAITEIDGARALTRLETDAGIEIGQFAAPAGFTRLTCELRDSEQSAGYFYSVAPTSPWVGLAATAALIVGILLLIGAGIMLVVGAQAKARLMPPSPPEPTAPTAPTT